MKPFLDSSWPELGRKIAPMQNELTDSEISALDAHGKPSTFFHRAGWRVEPSPEYLSHRDALLRSCLQAPANRPRHAGSASCKAATKHENTIPTAPNNWKHLGISDMLYTLFSIKNFAWTPTDAQTHSLVILEASWKLTDKFWENSKFLENLTFSVP